MPKEQGGLNPTELTKKSEKVIKNFGYMKNKQYICKRKKININNNGFMAEQVDASDFEKRKIRYNFFVWVNFFTFLIYLFKKIILWLNTLKKN